MNFHAVSKDSTVLMFFVNGRKILEKNADPETTLLTYLRNTLNLTGSKLGCGEGGCGACTVMVSKWDENKKEAEHFAVNSCLAPVVSMHKCAVTTIEGIGSTKTKLHQVQERLARFHGAQCGFCTPGIVMSMYALLRNKRVPTSRDIDDCLQGNLCRCTGYRPIVEAFETFSCCKGGDKCCRNEPRDCCRKEDVGKTRTFLPYDPTQEMIFPPELLMLGKAESPLITSKFAGERVTWFQPSSLSEVVSLKSDFPDARIVVGNTEVGIETAVKGNCYPYIIFPVNVPEMNALEVNEDGIRIGSSCSLKKVSEFLGIVVEQAPIGKTQAFSAILKMFHLFAGAQIRNVACLGGNIMTASPISDLNPIFVVTGAKLKFASLNCGLREVVMDENFFIGYRKTLAASDEVLVDIALPFNLNNEVMLAFKQSKRRDDDIAIVNAAMRVVFCPGTTKVDKFFAAFGGMAPVTKVPRKTMDRMIGRSWNEELFEDTCKWLNDDMELNLDAPGGMVEYRRTLVTSFFFKFYHHVLSELYKQGVIENDKSMPETISGMIAENRTVQGTQTWEEVSDQQNEIDTIGRPIAHLSVEKHVTGESEYVDDMPAFQDELHMALVYSSRAHARILNVDTTEALACKGVVAYFSKDDVMGQNRMLGEQVFADGKVTCIGDVIGAIVADTQAHALIASRLVQVDYEDIHPRIITIEEAIEHNSYHVPRIKIIKGEVENTFEACDHIIEGEMRVGGQEHFYLETQSCIAVPHNKEGEMEIWSSCQNPTMLQVMIGLCLGLPRNKVFIRTKRIGGGFGGKETQFYMIATPAAVAAKILGRPIRCILTRQDDMQVTGGRHPFLGRYKVGFNHDGRVIALREELYANAGNTLDLSQRVASKAAIQADNCYNIPNMEIYSHTCRTNIVSNTALRGFGSPQSTIITEDWITRISSYLNKSPEEIRKLNLYKDGDTTHFAHTLQNCLIERCWQDVMEKSDYEVYKKEIEEFNAQTKWKKRGISCVPSRFAIGFGETYHLSQAGALVVIYSDGSVLLSHGGTEMGQGLHTKMCQIASRVLGIPLCYIHISETSTASVPNTTATAASTGSDFNGMAVKNACEKILERLQPLKKENPELDWPKLIQKAYMERINLSATGHYEVPGLDSTFDFETGIIKGNMFNYLTYGAAVSQVEIDVLTGHHIVLRTDIVIDVGNSLNPAIDVGQVEGAFMQGYGLVTLEEHMYSPSGKLWTVGPGAYKIPGFSDAPKQLNVHFLKGCPNDKAIYSSKAIGEPPLLSACSVFFAIKEAIASARKDNGLSGPFQLDSPATSAKIRMGCGDKLSVMASSRSAGERECKPWAIRP